jgi:hypothetical protein
VNIDLMLGEGGVNPLAYSMHHYGTGSWVAHIVVGSLIHRAVWAVTRGMSAGMLVLLAVVAVGALWAWNRRA